MPGEDGYTLSKRCARRSRGRPTHPGRALTAYVRVEDRARALAAGFNMSSQAVESNELVTAIANLAEESKV